VNKGRRKERVNKSRSKEIERVEFKLVDSETGEEKIITAAWRNLDEMARAAVAVKRELDSDNGKYGEYFYFRLVEKE